MQTFIDSSPGSLGSLIFDLTDQLINKQLEQFFQSLKGLFAGIPYNIFIPDKEAYYHSVIFLVLTLLGVHIRVEVQTNSGRTDATIETGDSVYILEFKMGSAQEAIDQIRNKNYAAPYLSYKKEVNIIGIGFDKEQRNITSHLHQQLQ